MEASQKSIIIAELIARTCGTSVFSGGGGGHDWTVMLKLQIVYL
jgi:hypothetical protein